MIGCTTVQHDVPLNFLNPFTASEIDTFTNTLASCLADCSNLPYDDAYISNPYIQDTFFKSLAKHWQAGMALNGSDKDVRGDEQDCCRTKFWHGLGLG
jgi:hypothetical protein